MSDTQKNKKPNVPNLRFPGFSGEWKVSTLKEECIVNPKTEGLEKEFLYIDLESVAKGRLVKQNIISRNDAPSRAQRVLSKWDIIYQCVRPYQLNNYIIRDESTIQRVASTGYAQIRTKHNPDFIYQLLHTKGFTDQVINRCTGTNYPAINCTDLSGIEINFPSIHEQAKIGELLTLIDQRIAIQSKIIEDLKKLKTALCEKFLVEISNSPLAELGKHCSITTGKLDANAMRESGEYMFFTCAKENYRTDTYAFEGDALLISGNGELGLCKYYSGKFNAYQRTYVLQNFDIDIQFAKLMIDSFLPRKIYREKNVGAMPYIVLSTLSELQIPVPNFEIQTHISTVLSTFANKIELEESVLTKLILMKNHILSQMFI